MFKIFTLYLLAGILTFANGLSGPFMLDDYAFFTPEIRDIRYLPSHFIPKAYKEQKNNGLPHGQPNFYFRPLAKAFPSISYALFRHQMAGHHVFNLVLLVAAGCMIFMFLRRTEILDERGAFVCGLFYIMHPINGVMVNYITASVFSAQVALMLGGLYCLIDPRCSSAPGSQEIDSWGAGTLGRWGSIALFILALFCHETALLLPFYAVVIFSFLKKEGSVSLRVLNSFRMTQWLWVMAFVWLVFRFFYASLGDSLLVKFARFDMNAMEYFASVVKLISWYLSKLIVPWDIVLIWATPVVRGGEIGLWFLVSLVLVVGSLGFLIRIKDQVISMGIAWLLIGFLPLPFMCLFQPTHGPMIEPHWFVFSGIGFFIVLTKIVLGVKRSSFSQVSLVILCAVMLVLSWRHNYLWADEMRYAKYWSEISPTNKAVLFHLGELSARSDQFQQAVSYYERSIRGTYQDYLAYQRIGLAYLMMGNNAQAQLNMMMSLHLEPRQPLLKEQLNDLHTSGKWGG